MKRFIEESFPVKEVSAESAREKNIRHGHISTLHIWWARRPLASSRATAYAALIPPPKDAEEWNAKRNFISDLSKWANSLNPHLVETARKEILEANGGVPPKVLDPFGGGGAIPLEALRLGCETYSNDLNPVAVLIQKCTLEYPQKYGKPQTVMGEERSAGTENQLAFNSPLTTNHLPLLEDVKKWGEWVLAEAKQELERFYPPEDDGSIPVGYIWARMIPCQNPSCDAEIPLIRQFWLANKAKKKVAFFPYVKNGDLTFKIVGDGYEPMPNGFDPSKGTVSRAVAVCTVCRGTVEAKLMRKLFQDGKAGERMLAVVTHRLDTPGKRYRVATDVDQLIFDAAKAYLPKKCDAFVLGWGIKPIPDEELPLMSGVFNVPLYGMDSWGDLFNARQKLALITFADKVKAAYNEMLKEGVEVEYGKAVVSYLALGIDKLVDYDSVLTTWAPQGEFLGHTFTKQALPMIWDYCELNPSSLHSAVVNAD